MFTNFFKKTKLLLFLSVLVVVSALNAAPWRTGEASAQTGNITGNSTPGEASATTGNNSNIFTPGEWLYLGPVTIPDPVYHDVPGINGSAWSTKQLLATQLADYQKWVPRPGSDVAWQRGKKLAWTRMKPDQDLQLNFGNAAKAEAAAGLNNVGWSAVYLKAERFLTADLTIESRDLLQVFLNGSEIISKTSSESPDNKPEAASHKMDLLKGTHLLLIKSVRPAGKSPDEWTLKVSIKTGEFHRALSSNVEPSRTIMQRDLSNAPRPISATTSPDGEFAAIHIRRDLPPEGSTEQHIDIRRISDGTLYRRFAGGLDISGMQWLPTGRRFSYTVTNGSTTDLWMVDLDTGQKERLLSDVEDFAGYHWSPDASSIIFSIRERHDPRRKGVLRYQGLQDRRPGYHSRTFLYQLNVPGKTTRRLTAGLLSTTLNSIHPDGTEILFTRSHEVYDERPYGMTEYVIMNLETMETDSLFSISFGQQAQFSPDGSLILITGGPNAFGDAGRNVPDTLIANDYDTQAYLFNRQTREVESVTRDFDPEILSASWSESGRYIYFTVQEKSFRPIYRYDVRRRVFQKFDSGPDAAGSLDLARNKSAAVFTGSGASDPPKVWSIDFTARNPQAKVLYDPGSDAFRHIRFGKVKPWTFENDFGEEIDGYVYYPPDFDKNRSYPVIVYYYGGTSPVSRSFGGRYPKELYASKGYLVYVLQPGGATGYGQEFSARHVNDWGEIAGREIIQGTRAFLSDHAYADRERVGAIGASYGGFMTMYLLTQTDIFAAAVSHAGISNLTSYWGEGFWGYQYSGVATAGSYPWNRKDIYVDRSPVFQADKIHTPLLLVTGMSDTNVPAGESLQMFTALKLLGRDVAFVAVENQDHHILDYSKFIIWKEAILSWFDKWLKDEPEWWEHGFGK